MNVRPSILCPIDYSGASAAALRYAAVIAQRFVTRLIVLAVDPLPAAPIDPGPAAWTRETSEDELARFVTETFGAAPAWCEYDVAVGKPSVEILRVARERSCDLIVMSSHGLTATDKWLCGSTTERVLRETTVPVLVTPPVNPGPVHMDDVQQLLGRIVVPVDLSPSSVHQTLVAFGLAEELNLPVVLVHVIEPLRSRLFPGPTPPSMDNDRRAVAEASLAELIATIPRQVRREVRIVHGDPPEEVARLVRNRHAGLVVMGLHGPPPSSPRMGSIAYRILCLSPALVLALPPKWTKPAHRDTAVRAGLFGEAASP